MRAAVRHVQGNSTSTVPSTSTPAISTSTRCVTVHRVCIMPAPPRSPPPGICSCSCVPPSSDPRATLLVRCSRSTSTHSTARARHHSHRGETTGGAHGARPEGTGTPERQATTGSTRAAQPQVPTATRYHRKAASTTGSTVRQTGIPPQPGNRNTRGACKSTDTSTSTSTSTPVRSPQRVHLGLLLRWQALLLRDGEGVSGILILPAAPGTMVMTCRAAERSRAATPREGCEDAVFTSWPPKGATAAATAGTILRSSESQETRVRVEGAAVPNADAIGAGAPEGEDQAEDPGQETKPSC